MVIDEQIYRLIKPLWAKSHLKNGLPNPDFIKEIKDFDIIEGYFTKDEIKQANELGFNFKLVF